jgi:N-acyl-D-aspartate/D-glutamate deacylase
LSLAPAKVADREAVIMSFVRVEAISRRVLEEGVRWQWISTDEYLHSLGAELGINAAALIGHIAVRHYVMGEDAVERPATAEEIAQMQSLVREGMAAGAVGFSTNQNPRHIREDRKPVAGPQAQVKQRGGRLEGRRPWTDRLRRRNGAPHRAAGAVAKHQS